METPHTIATRKTLLNFFGATTFANPTFVENIVYFILTAETVKTSFLPFVRDADQPVLHITPKTAIFNTSHLNQQTTRDLRRALSLRILNSMGIEAIAKAIPMAELQLIATLSQVLGSSIATRTPDDIPRVVLPDMWLFVLNALNPKECMDLEWMTTPKVTQKSTSAAPDIMRLWRFITLDIPMSIYIQSHQFAPTIFGRMLEFRPCLFVRVRSTEDISATHHLYIDSEYRDLHDLRASFYGDGWQFVLTALVTIAHAIIAMPIEAERARIWYLRDWFTELYNAINLSEKKDKNYLPCGSNPYYERMVPTEFIAGPTNIDASSASQFIATTEHIYMQRGQYREPEIVFGNTQQFTEFWKNMHTSLETAQKIIFATMQERQAMAILNIH